MRKRVPIAVWYTVAGWQGMTHQRAHARVVSKGIRSGCVVGEDGYPAKGGTITRHTRWASIP